jgi:hypothetical protein
MFCTHIFIGQNAAERSEGGPDSLKHLPLKAVTGGK